jgi:hypothetical protein
MAHVNWKLRCSKKPVYFIFFPAIIYLSMMPNTCHALTEYPSIFCQIVCWQTEMHGWKMEVTFTTLYYLCNLRLGQISFSIYNNRLEKLATTLAYWAHQ